MAPAPGDRVRVSGGNDGDRSAWLCGGPGYEATVLDLRPRMAAVAFDGEVVVEAPKGGYWQDFGRGSRKAVGQGPVARGRWAVLLQAWVGRTWDDPGPLHVALCEEEPDLGAIPEGGGIGWWVESHAEIEPRGEARGGRPGPHADV